MDGKCVKDGPHFTPCDGTPSSGRPMVKGSVVDTGQHDGEECGEREINTRMKIMWAGKDFYPGQDKTEILHQARRRKVKSLVLCN